jgi:hypothetical protein
MAPYVAFAKGVKINGETILSVLKGMGENEEMARKFLAESDIQNPQPGQWYWQQAWLNAFRKIAAKMGAEGLWAMGNKVPENTLWPPEVDDVHKALVALDVIYQSSHRGGEIGHYEYQKTGLRSALMVCRTSYPEDFDRGLVGATVRKFKPQDSKLVTVRHDDLKPCRKKGADSCTYVVKW